MPGPSRRFLLKAGAAAGGGLLVGFVAPGFVLSEPDHEPGVFEPNAFIRLDRSGTATLIMPQVEMGQGIYTSIAMILAEEMDLDLDRVQPEAAPPDDRKYANALLRSQVTGNSSSIRAFWTPLRKAGAGARTLLVQAAAGGWGVSPGACRTEPGEVVHDASGRRLAYGALVDQAAALTAPADPPLKDPKSFRLIGKPLKRLDTPAKVNGAARFGIDV